MKHVSIALVLGLLIFFDMPMAHSQNTTAEKINARYKQQLHLEILQDICLQNCENQYELCLKILYAGNSPDGGITLKLIEGTDKCGARLEACANAC